MSQYHVYILKSLQDNGYYVGITKNLKARLKYHNHGYVRSTKSRIPFEMIYSEGYGTCSEARKREKYLKSYTGSREKLSIVEKVSR